MMGQIASDIVIHFAQKNSEGNESQASTSGLTIFRPKRVSTRALGSYGGDGHDDSPST